MDQRREDMGSTWVLRNLKQKQASDSGDIAKDGVLGSSKTDDTELTGEGDLSPTKVSEESSPAGNRLRVLAYSDSDSDVESHAKQVQELLPGKDGTAADEAEALLAAAVPAETEEMLPSTENNIHDDSSSQLSLAHLMAAVSNAIVRVARHITPGVVLSAAALQIIGSLRPSIQFHLELSAFAVGACSLVARRHVRRRGVESSPTPVMMLGMLDRASDVGGAAALILALRVATETRRRMQLRRLERLLSPVNISVLEETPPTPLTAREPQCAAEWAAAYPGEMREMRRILVECGVDLSGRRWDETNAELMRYATACGLMEADTPAARATAIESAVRRIINTVEWLEMHPSMPESKLRRWERLVSWRGADATGRPILLIRLGRALQLCTKSGRLDAFAEVVMGQVAVGVAERLSNAPDSPEKIVAIVDCRETSNWEALQRSRDVLALTKTLAVKLAAHYPERLERLHLLDLPLLARMSLQAVLTPLAQRTRDRIVQATATDDSLPVTVALLQKRRSYARGLERTMSDLSLATTECSSPRTADEGAYEEPVVAATNFVTAGDEIPDGAEPTTFLSSSEMAVHAPELRATSSEINDQVSTPIDSDVATNLLETLDEAAGRNSPGSPLAFILPPEGGPVGAPLLSHRLPATPDTISPQSSEGPATMSELTGPEMRSSSNDHGTPAPGGRIGFLPGPWAGLTALLGGMLPSASQHGHEEGSRFPLAATMSRGKGGSRLRAHRVIFSPGVLSKENSSVSVGSGSNTPDITPLDVGSIKGGLKELPPRPSSARKTPSKPSLRRAESQETPRTATGELGSFPLRRQSSVSWAENLERVREIYSPSPIQEGSPWPVSLNGEGVPWGGEESHERVAAVQQTLPVLAMLLMAASLLQRLLLEV